MAERRPRPMPEGATTARPADFAAALRSPSHSRTPHFALHHTPLGRAIPVGGPAPPELSTVPVETKGQPVDEGPAAGLGEFAAVVPKRHARRAVTRSMLKRQIREAGRRHRSGLTGGLWIVRLRAPFERLQYPSAASAALKAAAREELEALLKGRRVRSR